MHNKKPRFTAAWRYIVVFAALEAFIFMLLMYNKNEQLNRHFRQNIEEVSSQYEAVFTEYQKLAEAVFCSVVDNNETKAILVKAIKNDNAKDVARQKLEDRMLPVYMKLKELGVKQFQFHFPDNTSFLRLHEPKKYGDMLLDFRHTVRMVNKDKKPSYAFEEGRAASGFRYVFPIFQAENYLGSVEFGINYEAITNSMRALSGAQYALVVKKDALDKSNIFKESQNGFSSFSLLEDYLLEGQDKRDFRGLETSLRGHSAEIKEKCAERKPFCLAIAFDNDMYTVSFYPIKDIRRVHTAYLISYKKDPAYEFYKSSFIRTFGVYTLFMGFLLTVIFLINKKRENIWELNSSLQRKSEELQAILDASGGGLAILSSDGRFIYANSAFCGYLGYTKDELQTFDLCAIGIESEVNKTNDALAESLQSGSCYNFKKTCMAKNGEMIIFGIQFTRLPDNCSLILSAIDITKDVEYAKTLELRATIDELTKVFNRRSLEANLDEAVQSAAKNSEELSVIVIDIDNFKKINDTYGHSVGDATLRDFSFVVKNSIRANDIFGRWGGEEFLLICKGLPLNSAAILAEKIRVKVEEYKFDRLPKVTCSFGVTEMKGGDTLQSLFDRADNAMYKAKNSGKNKVVTAAIDD